MNDTLPIGPGAALGIPLSTSTVSVSVIDTTSSILGVDTWKFIQPPIAGHDYLATPSFSFLIEHRNTDTGALRRLIFDLGIRKDWWNYSPFLQRRFKAGGYEVTVDKSVREILEANGVSCDGQAIEAVIWSHWHWDHTGNPAEFSTSTKLVVGAGFREGLLPGYPTNPESSILESDYQGRVLEEVNFISGLKIGGFRAHDYFGDGSFFLLDTPGHAVGHLCGLARVTSSPDSFVFLGGDIAHHAGEWRPSELLPLPENVTPDPFKSPASPTCSCPGAIFEHLGNETQHNHPQQRTVPFYKPAKLEVGQIHADVEQCVASIEKMQTFDGQADENVLVLVAHDESLLDIVDMFPKTVNDFMKKDVVKRVRWRFLRDFAVAIGRGEEVERKQQWGPSS